MSDRLRNRDVALLATDAPSTPMHNATVEVFEPGASGFDYPRLLALVGDRIAFVPRYRQKLAAVPGRLANPVWVDDREFDLAYHVRRSALPRPGSDTQLRELVARIVSRPLDRQRPLWEIYFIEGLRDGRVAMLSKAHQVLVDGVHTVDLAQVLLDKSPDPQPFESDEWRPATEPSPAGLVLDVVKQSVADPGTLLANARGTLAGAVRTADGASKRVGAIAAALANRSPDAEHPLRGRLSQQRRVVGVRTDLADYNKIRAAHGGTVNDVILATITGGLRYWLMNRAESMGGLRQVRAMVPLSVVDKELESTSLGNPITPYLVDLPTGEASPVVRLHQVSYAFKAHKETGRGVAATRLARISGFAPSTFHAIGSRLAAAEIRRGFHLTVTNVPGPQSPLYAAGAEMTETYPVLPLLPGHALAIGVTSYASQVFYGITADRDLVPDAEVLEQCVREALDELLDTVTGSRPRAPRGRKPTARSKK